MVAALAQMNECCVVLRKLRNTASVPASLAIALADSAVAEEADAAELEFVLRFEGGRSAERTSTVSGGSEGASDDCEVDRSCCSSARLNRIAQFRSVSSAFTPSSSCNTTQQHSSSVVVQQPT